MNTRISGVVRVAMSTAAFVSFTGLAIGAAQSPTPATQGTRTSADQSVTLTGCIQNEADYRRSAGVGRGGAVGTGVGVGNEFVLTSATMAPAASGGAAATSGANPPSATGTAGASSSRAYELTGPNEGQAATHVGKRVEITGRLKDTGAAGGPTGNVVGSQDLKLAELEISSIRETTGTCTATP